MADEVSGELNSTNPTIGMATYLDGPQRFINTGTYMVVEKDIDGKHHRFVSERMAQSIENLKIIIVFKNISRIYYKKNDPTEYFFSFEGD